MDSVASSVAGWTGRPNIWTTRVVSIPSSVPLTTATPVSVYLGWTMLALWVGESIQAPTMVSVSSKSRARFSPATVYL